MWWFIVIACVLPVIGWLLFDVIGDLAILGCILSSFGLPGLQKIMGLVILAIYLPAIFLAAAMCTDLWWSWNCWSGSPRCLHIRHHLVAGAAFQPQIVGLPTFISLLRCGSGFAP
jgi:hypothetical protein